MAEINCPHFASLSRERFADENSPTFANIRDKNIPLECAVCRRRAQHIWLCLNTQCLMVLCSDISSNHLINHYKKDPSHCVYMNLSNLRLWCYECETEIVIGVEEEEDETHTMTVEPQRPRGLTGLQNLGNTCYMNSALQALCNTPPLVHYFLERRYEERPVSVPRFSGELNSMRGQWLTSALHNLILDMWSGIGQEYLIPAPILYAISHTHPMFRGFQQHDSQEFLRCLMDQLHEEMKVAGLEPLSNTFCQDESSDIDFDGSSEGEEYETCDSGVSERSSLSDDTNQLKPVTLSISRSSSPTEHRKAKNQGHGNPPGTPSKNKKVHYRSIISDIFDGTLLSSVQCLTCNRISTRVEAFQDLSLPIPNRDHLNILHQGNVSGPPKCSHLYTIEQGWFAWLWDWVCSLFWGPTVSLHDCLSAFFSADELKGDNMYSCEKCNKLRNGVKYSRVLKLPEVLCIHLKRFRHDLMFSSKITSYISFPMEGLDMKAYMHQDCTCSVTRYELMSVICHHGSSGSGGHYTCYALNTPTDQWYHYDDHSVTKVSPQTVKNSQAYVLFYRKESTKMRKIRKRFARLQDLSQYEPRRYLVSSEWMSRFNSLSEPGPIDNRRLLYGAQDGNASQGLRASVSLSGPVWSYLHKTFGGGPQITTDMSFNLIDSHYNAKRENWGGERWEEKSNSQGDDTSSIYCGGLTENSEGDNRSVDRASSCDNQDSGIWIDQKNKDQQNKRDFQN
ncbi:hypothetical protein O3M35_005587 [Rhynocoris fuscipes]